VQKSTVYLEVIIISYLLPCITFHILSILLKITCAQNKESVFVKLASDKPQRCGQLHWTLSRSPLSRRRWPPPATTCTPSAPGPPNGLTHGLRPLGFVQHELWPPQRTRFLRQRWRDRLEPLPPTPTPRPGRGPLLAKPEFVATGERSTRGRQQRCLQSAGWRPDIA